MSYRANVPPKDQKTMWLQNTPLMLAVKNQQIETVKQLVLVYKANTDIKNAKGKTAADIARISIKDPHVLETIQKLVLKQSASTRVVRNRDAIEERK